MAVRLRWAIALLAWLAASAPASAQTIAETASRWGLVGSWRLNCKVPVDRNNADLKYVVRSGKLFHDREFGNSRDSSVVMSAKLLPGGVIEIIVNFTSLSQVREFSFMKNGNNSIRAMSNRNVNTGEYSVKAGKFTSGGGTTPWQIRCK